jgi:membrane-bound serine protease (ClpP class)
MPRSVLAGLALSLALGLRLAAQSPAPAPAPEPGPAAGTVLVAEYDGIIHPVSAEFFGEFLSRADRTNAALAVLILRTPGGLLESTRTMVSAMIAAKTPVVVFVAPSGARAASAGFILALAADVAAMAPGTHIGAAHPVSASGQDDGGETMRDKAASDTAAYARTLATSRGRNIELAGDAVVESRAFTDQEALTATPPLIDLVAADLPALLVALDGRRVKRFDGHQVTLNTAGVPIERVEMTRRQQLLSAIAHPQIAYLLFSLGMLGLVVELWNPGFVVPGVVGGICLLLAFFAFQVLPVNAAGILLIVLGIGLLVMEVTVPSFGVLGVGGIFALLAGSIMLTREIPDLRVNYGMLVPATLTLAVIMLGLGRLAAQSQRLTTVTGAEGMPGKRGEVITALSPGRAGQVNVHGEIWRAVSDTPLAPGAAVRIASLDGLTLRVEPVDSRPDKGDAS